MHAIEVGFRWVGVGVVDVSVDRAGSDAAMSCEHTSAIKLCKYQPPGTGKFTLF
jgi:hypothetical protein